MARISDIVSSDTMKLLGWDGSKKEDVVQARIKKRPHKRKVHSVKKAKKSHSSSVSGSRVVGTRQIVRPKCVKCGRQCTTRNENDPGTPICEPCAYALQRRAGQMPQPLPPRKKKKRNEFVRIVYSAVETNRRKH